MKLAFPVMIAFAALSCAALAWEAWRKGLRAVAAFCFLMMLGCIACVIEFGRLAYFPN